MIRTPYDITFPYQMELREYQDAVWEHFALSTEPGLRGLTVWPRRNGKDLIALNILTAKSQQRVGLYLYIGPLQNQVRQIIWLGTDDDGRKFVDYIPPQLIKKKRDSQMEIELVNGSMIKLVGSDRYDSLMGLNAVGAVFTEYSLQRPEAWDYIRPMMANNGGWALFNGTPRGLNHMHGMARMAEKNPDWFYQYFTRDDTGYPTLEAIQADRDAGMKESLIEQEYYCNWTASQDEVFIPLDIIEPCTLPEAELDPVQYAREPRILGCDVAYAAKGDKAVIAYRQGRKLHWVRWYKGKDNMAFAKEIDRFIKIVKPHAVNIDAGRGEGVISRLEQLGHDHIVFPVHFGGKVYEEGIANMKALMWQRMEDWFMDYSKPDLTGLDDSPYANEEVSEELITELSTPFKERDEKNQIKVESKKSLATRGVSSHDLADGVCLTFAHEIEADDIMPAELEQLGLTSDMVSKLMDNTPAYNPLEYMDQYTNTEGSYGEEQEDDFNLFT